MVSISYVVKNIHVGPKYSAHCGTVSQSGKKVPSPHKVRSPAVNDALPQTVARHLRWIMQKDLLGQDVFLIGPPGPLRRSIAMQYLVQ